MSEISKIYAQFASSLRKAQADHRKSLNEQAETIQSVYDDLLEPHLRSFGPTFKDQVERIELRSMAESFLGSADIPFVAIDGSCARDLHQGHLVFFGGAYGSRGTVSLSAKGGELQYDRWEINKDVSMVAFVPIPPESGGAAVEQPEGQDFPYVASDWEVSQISSIHTKIMQLAEVYLANSLAGSSTIEAPRILLIDGSLSGLLGNTSFAPNNLALLDVEVEGIRLDLADAYGALARPFSEELGVPSDKAFQPQNRLFAQAVWTNRRTVDMREHEGQLRSTLRDGAGYMDRLGIGDFDGDVFTFGKDPRRSWRKCVDLAERICVSLFKEKDYSGISFPRVDDPERERYLTSRDIQFLTGVMLRSLIERCWSEGILLIGVTKDSNSRYFIRNYLGARETLEDGAPYLSSGVHLSDRPALELVPNVVEGLEAPWSTLEFDSAFMTLRPRHDKTDWIVGGTPHPSLGETSRPERLFLRSIAQFFRRPDGTLAAHAVFLDRLAYPGWDDKDAEGLPLDTDFFGEVNPLTYQDDPSRLQRLSMYLLTTLVKNHFPEAIGYPDPLHKADWGAKSMRKRAAALLKSSEWAERSNPRSRTFRQIRDRFRR